MVKCIKCKKMHKTNSIFCRSCVEDDDKEQFIIMYNDIVRKIDEECEIVDPKDYNIILRIPYREGEMNPEFYLNGKKEQVDLPFTLKINEEKKVKMIVHF